MPSQRPLRQRRLRLSDVARMTGSIAIDTCRCWLESERELVHPRLVLALGASAARSMLGKTISVQRERGRPLPLPDGSELWITVHPSYLLRLKDDARRTEQARFADDLAAVARRLGEPGATR